MHLQELDKVGLKRVKQNPYRAEVTIVTYQCFTGNTTIDVEIVDAVTFEKLDGQVDFDVNNLKVKCDNYYNFVFTFKIVR